MKYLILVVLLGLLVTLLVGSTEASFCPCNLRKAEVCGSNGVTYRNRCEFECSQREYKKLGRILNIRKQGPCFQNKWN